MEIIHKGRLPEDQLYQATCENCKTEVTFRRKEAKAVFDQRDGDFLHITCPLEGCGSTIYAML